MNIIVLGHNHSTASVNLREKFAFGPERLRSALGNLRTDTRIEEAVILSTCNRNEIYCAARNLDRAEETVTRFLYSFHGVQAGSLDSTLYCLNNKAAVEHLFSVASGIDSLMVGETQILSQIKQTYQAAVDAKSTGIILNRLLHKGLETAKLTRHLTNISNGVVSVGSAAAAMAKKIFSSLDKKTVLLMGAGETGELTARNLLKHGATDFIVCNRTYERAVALAKTLGGRAIELAHLQDVIEKVDILITSTSSGGFVLSAEDVSELMHMRKNSPLFIIDLAVPRDIDPRAGKIYNVFLYDIDNLSSISEKNKIKREKEAAKARTIIKNAAEDFMDWHRSLAVTPTIIALRNHFELIRHNEIARYSKKLPPEAEQVLEQASKSIVNKILHSPSIEIKKAVETSGSYALAKTVRQLFRLRDDHE
jgi:glutamyl-tRNA reductase